MQTPLNRRPKNSRLAAAIQQAATKIKLLPTARPLRSRSQEQPKLLQERREKIPLTAQYHSPLFKPHFIPTEHTPPPIYIRKPPSVYDLSRKTTLKDLITEDEPYDIPQNMPDKFAIIAPWHYGFRQYKVMIGDRIMVDLYYNIKTGKPYNINDEIIFDNILLIGTRNETVIGRPLIPGVKVIGVMEEITRLAKKRWIWKKQRHRKQRIRGIREWVSIIRIKDIKCNNLPLYNNYHNNNDNNNINNNDIDKDIDKKEDILIEKEIIEENEMKFENNLNENEIENNQELNENNDTQNEENTKNSDSKYSDSSDESDSEK